MAGWGNSIVLCDRWTPVDEVWWNRGVWAELDVVVAFIYKGAVVC